MSIRHATPAFISRNAALRKSCRALPLSRRCVHDGRNRLSNFWTPTQYRKADLPTAQDGHDLLVRAGYLRQSHAGIFHMLPLGLRVQNKIESLIDKHMSALGASKVSLSSLSSQDLWERSGRLAKGRENEFFKLQDRKQASFLLSPTHEEEITSIVASAVHSYKDLPLRLYQVSRKYRDEARPRQGLLRGREFIMKDLYTFDESDEAAMATYEAVQTAYRNFFDELGLPYLVAKADSGNMGGNHSHEYHFASSRGEDTIISCDTCNYSANEEAFREVFSASSGPPGDASSPEFRTFYARLKSPQAEKLKDSAQSPELSETSEKESSRQTIVQIHVPGSESDVSQLNLYAIKDIVPNLDTSVPVQISPPGEAAGSTSTHIHICDPRVPLHSVHESFRSLDASSSQPKVLTAPVGLLKAQQGHSCPHCSSSDANTGRLQLTQAVEIGHTFHLGTRYSVPLQATVHDRANKQITVSMGCHGVGVTRLVGASATLLADAQGLNWPLAIAPFSIMILPAKKHVTAAEVAQLYDSLAETFRGTAEMDLVVDDRDLGMGWSLNDADLIGYPFVVVLGKGWVKGEVELQCRYMGIKENVQASDLGSRLQSLRIAYHEKTRARV